ncbi:MAG: hypothetical protein FD129_3117, partial [bacterium]
RPELAAAAGVDRTLDDLRRRSLDAGAR